MMAIEGITTVGDLLERWRVRDSRYGTTRVRFVEKDVEAVYLFRLAEAHALDDKDMRAVAVRALAVSYGQGFGMHVKPHVYTT